MRTPPLSRLPIWRARQLPRADLTRVESPVQLYLVTDRTLRLRATPPNPIEGYDTEQTGTVTNKEFTVAAEPGMKVLVALSFQTFGAPTNAPMDAWIKQVNLETQVSHDEELLGWIDFGPEQRRANIPAAGRRFHEALHAAFERAGDALTIVAPLARFRPPTQSLSFEAYRTGTINAWIPYSFDAGWMGPGEIHTHIEGEQAYSRVDSFLASNDLPLQGLRRILQSLPGDRKISWIEISTCAEIGMKECLSLVSPAVAPILIHVPSPPPNKLWGKISRELMGIDIPYRKVINHGAEVRNALVHQHDAPVPSAIALHYYRKVTKAALFMLQSLGYGQMNP